MIFFRHKLLFFLGLTIHLTAFSQRYNFRNFSVSDGLVGSTVNSILQDANGRLLIGTDNGFNDFDGIDFRNFSRQFGLSGITINKMLIDKQQHLWIGTEKGLYRIIGKKIRLNFIGEPTFWSLQ